MNYKKIDQNGLNVTYSVIVPSEKIESIINNQLAFHAPKLKGFRKITPDMKQSAKNAIITRIRSMYDGNEDAMKGIIQDATNAFLQNEIRAGNFPLIFSKPEIEIKSYKKGSELQSEVKVELYPDDIPEKVELDEKESLTKLECKVDDKDIEKQIEVYRKHLTENVYSKAAKTYKYKDGDMLTIDIDVMYKGNKEQLQSNYRTDAKGLTPLFAEKIVNCKAGDVLTVTSQLPKASELPKNIARGSGYKKLAGKDTDYIITIKSIEKSTLTAPDDETLLKKTGTKDLDDLKKQIKEAVEQQASVMSEQVLIQDFVKIIKKKLSFDIPKTLLDMHVNKQMFAKIQEIYTKKSEDAIEATKKLEKEAEGDDKKSKTASGEKDKKNAKAGKADEKGDKASDEKSDSKAKKSSGKDEKSDKDLTPDEIMKKYELSKKEKDEIAQEIRLDFFISELASKIQISMEEQRAYRMQYSNMQPKQFQELISDVRRQKAMSAAVSEIKNVKSKALNFLIYRKN